MQSCQKCTQSSVLFTLLASFRSWLLRKKLLELSKDVRNSSLRFVTDFVCRSHHQRNIGTRGPHTVSEVDREGNASVFFMSACCRHRRADTTRYSVWRASAVPLSKHVFKDAKATLQVLDDEAGEPLEIGIHGVLVSGPFLNIFKKQKAQQQKRTKHLEDLVEHLGHIASVASGQSASCECCSAAFVEDRAEASAQWSMTWWSIGCWTW